MRGKGVAAALLGLLAMPAPLAAQPSLLTAAPVVSWQGFYIGGHLGAAFAHTEASAYNDFLYPPILLPGPPLTLVPGRTGSLPGASGDDASLIGGIQGGYNWQRERFVFGIEADFSLTSLRAGASVTGTAFPTLAQTVTNNYVAGFDWVATLRGRLCVAVDRALVYVTAGLALADLDIDTTTTSGFPPPIIAPAPGSYAMTTGASTTRLGWVVGAGLEWAFNERWRLAAEYRHLDFGTFSAQFAIPDGLGTTFYTGSTDLRLTADQVTLRVNYRLAAR